jgi:SAM-dependent methyltransferase
MKRENDLQRAYWEDLQSHADRRLPDHPVIAAFARPKLALAAQQGAFQENTTVLDVGCGNGFFTYHLPTNVQAVGLDLSSVMLRLNPCSSLVQGSALTLPFSDCTFDTVFCSNLLHHLCDPSAAVMEMRRVSRRYVVLSEPNRNNLGMLLFGVVRREERGTLKFTTTYLRRVAKNAGLNVKACHATGMIFPNRTPGSLLPLLRWMDRPHPWGAYILLVAKRTTPALNIPD